MSSKAKEKTKVMGAIDIDPFSGARPRSEPEPSCDAPMGATEIAIGLAMFADGADIVDVRAGIEPPMHADQLDRAVAVVAALSEHGVVSINTANDALAKRAVAAGATIINDAGGNLGPLAGASKVGYVARLDANAPDPSVGGPPPAMVASGLNQLAQAAAGYGAAPVWIAPPTVINSAFEFANLGRLTDFLATGWPVLVDVKVAPERSDDATDSPINEASIAATAWSILAGVAIVRVPEITSAVQTLQVVAA